MQITHLGHSCLLIETGGQRILIDPGNFSDFSQVQDLTLILATHQHPDHLDSETVPALLEANPKAQVVLEPAAAMTLRHAAPNLAARVKQLEPYEPLVKGRMKITPVGDQHAFIHDYVPRIHNLGLVIEAEGRKLFHPGDALDATGKCLEDIDILCVPINAPWARVADTVEFVRSMQPKAVIPIHDALLQPQGRAMYLGHVANFGLDGGVTVYDLVGKGPVEF